MNDSPARIDPEEAAIGPPTTARRLVEASVSPNTRWAYAGALRRLDAWLDGRELPSSRKQPGYPWIPPEIVPPVLQSGIQSAIQGKWMFTRRIEGCAKPQAPGVSQAAHHV